VKPGTTAVIFISKRASTDPEGYAKAAARMESAAKVFPGYCGLHSVRGADGVGITISYWDSDEAAKAWKVDSAHSTIREQGRSTWYEWYELIVAQVSRGYRWRS
jgi:heme-degrading monooxygenase HmoA